MKKKIDFFFAFAIIVVFAVSILWIHKTFELEIHLYDLIESFPAVCKKLFFFPHSTFLLFLLFN